MTCPVCLLLKADARVTLRDTPLNRDQDTLFPMGGNPNEFTSQLIDVGDPCITVTLPDHQAVEGISSQN